MSACAQSSYVGELPSLEIAAIRELSTVDQWVCWKFVQYPGEKKPRKVPCQASGINASTTNPDTWSSFERCTQAFVAGGYDGLGFVFSRDDDFVGVDFDDILDDSGVIKDPSIARWVRDLDAYTEVSPSGKGLKVFTKGTLPKALNTQTVEMYSEARFFTVTGQHFAGSPDVVKWAEAVLSELFRATSKEKKRERKAVLAGEPIREGGRHDALKERAVQLGHAGLSAEEIRGALHGFNESRCDPPEDAIEVDRLAQWTGENVEGDTKHDPVETVPTIVDAIFKGSALSALADRPAPPPSHPLHSLKGHLNVLVAAAFTGKSSVQYHLAMARAAGVAPWSGAPVVEPSETLIYSPDQPAEDVARRIRSLSQTHPGGSSFDYASRLSVLGLDQSVDADLLDGLRLDPDGVARWDNLLEATAPAHLLIDAYGDVLPFGTKENDNDHARKVAGALESLAVKHGTTITLLHHVGKLPPGTKTADIAVQELGRGATALAQKARAVFTLEEVPGQNHLRRTRARMNGGRSPAPLELEVCEVGRQSAEIVFFKPHDPLIHYRPGDYIEPGEWISTTELARRLDRAMNPDAETRDPPGAIRSLSGELRREWDRMDLLETRDGARNSKEMKAK